MPFLTPRQFRERVERVHKEKFVPKLVQVRNLMVQKTFRALTVDSRTVGFQSGSPVWSGRYRASFTVSVNLKRRDVADIHPGLLYRPPLFDHPDEPSSYVKRLFVLSDVLRLLQTAPVYSIVWISQALPYVNRIEFEGHSPKTPEGVFLVSLKFVKRTQAPALARFATRIARLS